VIVNELNAVEVKSITDFVKQHLGVQKTCEKLMVDAVLTGIPTIASVASSELVFS
jgi:hypothetical protein